MTQKIKAQILAVRDDGGSNMFDIDGVMRIAFNLHLFELVNYLADRDNRREYSQFIQTGKATFEDEDEEDEEADEESEIVPIDMNDPESAKTAKLLEFPDTFCARAYDVIRYFEGSMYLFRYKGRYVVTDEALYLTEHGNGTHEAPYGGPRWVGDDLDELESWLEGIAADYDDAGDIPGWPPV